MTALEESMRFSAFARLRPVAGPEVPPDAVVLKGLDVTRG
jgi:hypothetical protein